MSQAVSSKELTDVSFAGSSITVDGVQIGHFMDDANPVEFQDTEVSGVGVNCNGSMIRYAKPNVVMMSVTVIPGSEDDKALYKKWANYRVQDGKNQASTWEKAISCQISVGNNGSKTSKLTSYTFDGGTMVSGPGGPSSTGEGKMQGRTYTFAFAYVAKQ